MLQSWWLQQLGIVSYLRKRLQERINYNYDVRVPYELRMRKLLFDSCKEVKVGNITSKDEICTKI